MGIGGPAGPAHGAQDMGHTRRGRRIGLACDRQAFGHAQARRAGRDDTRFPPLQCPGAAG